MVLLSTHNILAGELISGTVHTPGQFSWMPNCSLGPLDVKQGRLKKLTCLGYVIMHGFHGNPKRLYLQNYSYLNLVPNKSLDIDKT